MWECNEQYYLGDIDKIIRLLQCFVLEEGLLVQKQIFVTNWETP